MHTRSAAKRLAQEQNDLTNSIPNSAAGANAAKARPAKRARHKGPSQPVKGGWDTLPHNLGPIEGGISSEKDGVGSLEQTNLGSSIIENVPPIHSARIPQNDGGDIDETNPKVAQEPTPTKLQLSLENTSGLLTPPLEVKGKNLEKSPTTKRIRHKTKANPYGLMFGRTPYPEWQGPSKEACEEVHKLLTELHGEVKAPSTAPVPSLTVAGCGEVPSVLDALLRTLLSAATTMTAANEAFASLVKKYGTVSSGVGAGSVDWDKVRQSSAEELAEAIKRGGLANSKAVDIKKILDMVLEEQGKLSLDHLHGMTAEAAMSKLVRYPRIGVKTAACVILFCLRVPCFAVDTHVHRFCKWLGWVPATASADLTFWHCEFLVPDQLKYGLHQLFIRHGQTCERCRANTTEGTETWKNSTCVLEHLLERNKKVRVKVGEKRAGSKKGEEYLVLPVKDDAEEEEKVDGELGELEAEVVGTVHVGDEG